MPFFIPIAIGVAVAGAAAASAVGVAVKKRADRKRQQREDAHPETPARERGQGEQPSTRPAQRPWRQQSQTAERRQRPQRENPGPQPVKQKQCPGKQSDCQPTERLRQQQPQAAEEQQRPQRQDEYHLVAEDLPDGVVKTRCGKLMDKTVVHGPGHLPCSQCYQASNPAHKR